MNKVILAGAALLALGACDTPNKPLVDSCLADGYDKKVCECLAKEAKKQLEPDVFNAMVMMAEGKEEEANAAMEAMPIEKRFSVASGMFTVMGACSVESTS